MNALVASLALGLAGSSSVHSLPTAPRAPARATTTTNTALRAGTPETPARHREAEASAASAATVDDACDFWGEPRNAREIAAFASAAVFDGGGAAAVSSERRRAMGQWVEVLSADPPLLVVHGFLEDHHCDAIVAATRGPSSSDSDGDASAKHRLKRSTTGNDQEASSHRTSSTAWLREDRCALPLRTFATRASALSGLPPRNMENLQVVRYRPGEEFRVHTDHLDSFNDYECGGRLCTCLVYLNDSTRSTEEASRAEEEEEAAASGGGGGGRGTADDRDEGDDGTVTFTGGETVFPEFGAAVRPTKGSALFFWNTLERPGSTGYGPETFLNVDVRTRHAGLPVLSGEKWVANRWIHPRNFGAGVRGYG